MQAKTGHAAYAVLFWIAAIMAVYAAIAFGGLAILSEGRRARYTPLVSAHGILILGWYVLIAVQARLAVLGQTTLHRSVGRMSVFWVVGLIAVSSVVLFNFFDETARKGTLVADLMILVSFAGLYAAAFVAIRRKAIDWHMRFMLASGVAMLGPAHGRTISILDLPQLAGLPLTIAGILFPLLTFDLLVWRKVHKATYVTLAILMGCLFAQAVAFALLDGFS